MNETLNFLNNSLNDYDTLIVACSSGPDSMCLLSIVKNLGKKLKIVCAHVNHRVRMQSEEEYDYLKKYCKDNQIIFEGTTLNEKIDSNFESKARKFRYDFFEKLFEKYQAKYILTAHHGDDLIETILMRIARGSTLSGYAGIKLLDNKYLRPLLFITKSEIIDYLTKNKIKYYNDTTNDEDDHLRNRYRHYILPFLKSENINIHKKYLTFSKKLLEYDSFIENYVNDKKLIIDSTINIKKLLEQNILVQKKAVEMLIKKVQKDNTLCISDEVLNNIFLLINNDKSNSRIDLNNNYIAIKDYNEFKILKKKNIELYNEKFDKKFNKYGFHIYKIDYIDFDNNNVIRLDTSEIKLPLFIRNRQIGDKMILKNLGTKKIKDIFIDSKISKQKRDEWPLLTDADGKILWIASLKKSKFAKDKSEKYDIILLCERKEI